ncbi:MAG TPA: carboxypeptidase-like regulatory domain-containing protein [Thermoanaerobaculia bacterium]
MKRALASVVLLLALFALPLRAATVPVNGRVVDSDGKAVPDAKVLLIPFLSEVEAGRLQLEGKLIPEPVAFVSPGADGAFRLAAPETGMWRVRVEAPGFVPQEALLVPLLEETDLPEVQLARDVPFQARVTDPQGKPVAGARVSLSNERRMGSAEISWRVAERRAVTDASGAVTLPRGKDEAVTVRAVTPGFPLAERKNVREGSATLRFAAGLTRRLQIRDPQGKPVPGVLVRVDDSDDVSWLAGRASEAGVLDLALPNRDGAELLLAAADGRRLRFRLKAAKPGPQQEPDVAVLPAVTPVSSRTVSARDGRPVTGALVWTSDVGAFVRTGADGGFKLPAPPAGESWIQAAAAGFLTRDGEIAGGRIPTLALEPVYGVAGKVVDEAGRPVAGADLRAAIQTSSRLMSNPNAFRSGGLGRSGESGRFRLGNLLPGFGYDLKVTRRGFAPLKLELPAREPGQPGTEMTIVLRAGRTAFGAVMDGGRQPVAGARVTLQPVPASTTARIRQARNPDKFEGVTDASGRFEIQALPAGTFDLTVRGRGFAPLTVPGLVVPDGKGRTDLGTVMLAPGAAVSGKVTDPKGNPIAGAEVRAAAAAGETMPFPIRMREQGPADALTGADGFFTLEDRAPGESLDLTVSHPGYGPGSAPGVAVPSEQPVRIVLQPNARVSGKVTGPDRRPVAGAQVNMSEMTSMSFGGGSSRLFAANFKQTVTDEEGAFSFENVAPGPIEVGASAPGRQRAQLEGLEVKAGQELTGVELLLAPGGVVEGRVSADGRPMPGVEVAVLAPTANDFSFPDLQATTDGDGQFRIDGIPPGPRTVEAKAEGYRRAVRDVEVTAETKTVELVLERGLDVSGRVVDDAGNPIASVTVRLLAGRNILNAPQTVTGADGAFTVGGLQDGTYRLMAHKEGYTMEGRGESVTVAGASVAGVEVKLSSGGTITGRLSGLEPSQLGRVRIWADFEGNQGQVDPEGGYRIPNQPEGSHEVTAIIPNTSLRATGRVTLEPGAKEARLDLQFGSGHELRGVVLRNGQPVAGASLGLTRTGTSERASQSTDHQGNFSFGGLEDGLYKLAVSAPNGGRQEEDVEINGDRDIRVELRTASLTGRVIDSLDLSPVSGARVTLEPAQASNEFLTLPDTQTDARGTFRILEVGGGAWKVRATRDGYAPAEQTVQVDGSDAEEIELKLQPTEGVTIEAQQPSGQAPDHLRVAVLGPQGETVASGSYPTGENGRTRVSNVPAGSWQLLVQSDQSAPATVSVSVPGPAVRVVLPAAGALRVKVPTLVGESVVAKLVLTGPGGAFRAMDFSGKVVSEWELFQGIRNLDRIPVGVWQLTVRTSDGRSWTGQATVTAGGTAEATLQ